MKVSITYKNNKKDRVRVSISHDDLWDGDVTLARVIYPFLKKYGRTDQAHNCNIIPPFFLF